MIKAIHFPINLTADELDEYLAKGWFRMGQTIFTTDFIPVEGRIHPVFWLRFDLKKISFGKKQKKLIAFNQGYTVHTQPCVITDELEDLYTLYRMNVDFDAPPTVESYLLDGELSNIYDSHLIEVRDEDRLIAAGIFDNGNSSIAGIMNFYDPAYKGRSPGKFLMLLKINHAIITGKAYYYPGYIAAGFTKFDYKLFPDPAAAEIYDTKKEKWIPFTSSALSASINFGIDNDLAR